MTRDIIKVLGWNLNFASYDNAMPATFIDKYIKNKKSEAIKEFAMKLIQFINDLNILPYTEGVVPCIKAKIKQIAEESEDES